MMNMMFMMFINMICNTIEGAKDILKQMQSNKGDDLWVKNI